MNTTLSLLSFPGAARLVMALGVVLVVLSIPSPSVAQSAAPSEAEQLREDLRRLKQDYEQRIRAMEERLRRLEVPAEATTNVMVAPASPATTATTTNGVARARQFAEQEFQRDTESREQALLSGTHPYAGRVEQVLQDFVDIHGYFRAGYGRNDEGGPQSGFQAPGAFAKYRLGNEAENYGELTFGKNFYVADAFNLDAPPAAEAPTGPVARFQTTFSIYNPYQDLLSSSGTDFGLPEVWASIGNVVESQPSMKFWAGSRFYRRHDIHINDFFFYNMSGTGGGVEDVELSFGKLAFAWIGAASSSGISSLPEPDASNKAGYSKANWDLRLYDVPLPLGKGEFGLTYARADSGLDSLGNSAPDSDGVAFTFLHTRTGVLSEDGVNKFSLQFGTGAAMTFNSGFEMFTLTNGVFIRPDDDESWRFRATEHFTANLSDSFSIGPAFVYQLSDYNDVNNQVHWASAGVRPIWHFNQNVSLAGEAGIDWVKDDGANTSDYLYKLTLAPQVSLGGRFMSRPVIRAFVTYAWWGDDFVGQVGGNDYAGENSGLTYGVQMEVWW
jgi:maltoporin